ncbi:hypothetical protein [Baekduia sp. Peel2402]|uniref:hypothetical protein n=1 Tax=Baekduia sp. Peel2402 TaxID=3458296 RepID=UPI00403E602F
MRRLVSLLLVAVALVVAACGGDDKPAAGTKSGYVAQVQEVGGQIQTALANISDRAGTAKVTVASYGTELDKSVAALDAAVKELDAITPPANAEAAHDKLVDGCRQLADAFRQTAVAARQDDPAALAKALQGVSAGEGAQKIAQAQAELKALGIQVADEQ